MNSKQIQRTTAAARGDAPTWLYRFSWRSPNFGSAVHCVDVPFFFDCLHSDRVNAIAGDTPPHALADDVHGVGVRCPDAEGETSVDGDGPHTRSAHGIPLWSVAPGGPRAQRTGATTAPGPPMLVGGADRSPACEAAGGCAG